MFGAQVSVSAVPEFALHRQLHYRALVTDEMLEELKDLTLSDHQHPPLSPLIKGDTFPHILLVYTK